MTFERDLTEFADSLKKSAYRAKSIDGDHPSLKSLLEQFLQDSFKNHHENSATKEQIQLFELEEGIQFLIGIQYIDQTPHVWHAELAGRSARNWVKNSVEEAFAKTQTKASVEQNFHDMYKEISERKLLATNMNLGPGIIPIIHSALEDSLQFMQKTMHQFLNSPKAVPVQSEALAAPAKSSFLGIFGRGKAQKQPDQLSQDQTSKPGGTKPGH